MKYKHFCKTERHELSILRKKGYSPRAIAEELGKHPSSVSRELRRNKLVIEGRYEAKKAHHKAYVRRKYSKYQGMKIREHPELEACVKEKIVLGWSPDRIAGRWNREHKRKIQMSAHAIYKWLYSAYGQYYCQYLKSKRANRRRRRYKHEPREIIKNRVSIGDRPRRINSRRYYGHFEGDTMGRSKHASLETLTVLRERKSRYLLGKKVKRLAHSMKGFKEQLNDIPALSVTFDNGVENVRHQELGISTYFCHPYSSWEKGGVENGIRLIREYIPKGSDLIDYSDEDIDAIFYRINNTPYEVP